MLSTIILLYNSATNGYLHDKMKPFFSSKSIIMLNMSTKIHRKIIWVSKKFSFLPNLIPDYIQTQRTVQVTFPANWEETNKLFLSQNNTWVSKNRKETNNFIEALWLTLYSVSKIRRSSCWPLHSEISATSEPSLSQNFKRYPNRKEREDAE